MNPKSLLRLNTFRRRGMALVIVIGALALATMLLLAMFSLSEAEYRSTQSYVASLSAKQYAETANAIIMAQIQNGQNTATNASARTIHATQPGMIRVYKADGAFSYALKLFSSADMRVDGPAESAVYGAGSLPPPTWENMPSKYVDLNEPAVRPALSGGGGAVSVHYPIIDPRAAFNYVGTQYTDDNPAPKGARTTQVEGFSYSNTTPSISGSPAVTYSSVTLPSMISDPNALRLPMPVEWIYFLQDGTMGTVDASSRFTSASQGSGPTAANPIVARVAFWTDDETSKININTASEPTFMAPPYYYHDRDRRWANFPAAAAEYQRYPGHPATVALSTVLAPNFRLDPLRPQDDGFIPGDKNSIVAIKEYIYNMTPKISQGGSLAGTVPYISDEFSTINGEGMTTASVVDTAIARAERLYASVDEMLFLDGEYSQNSRVAARYNMPGVDGVALFDHNTLERSRFFLTAHSRAPEFSMYGLPRVCVWPIADEMGRAGGPNPDRLRTNFDNMIALCATLRTPTSGQAIENSYYFRRAHPQHSTQDVSGTAAGFQSSPGLRRNSRLLEYLVNQMASLEWPQTGVIGNQPNYSAKYGIDNVRQLAIQFFDYVRCINLYDGVLARGNDGTPALNANGAMLSGTALYNVKDQISARRYTYTNQRGTPPATNVNASANSAAGRQAADDAGVLPGHGQVTPAVWSTGGRAYMGFGRMFTLSEVGLHFICTADGANDDYAVDFNGVQSGGGTAFRAVPTLDVGNPPTPSYVPNSAVHGGMNIPQTNNAVWWSNFPPILFGTESQMETVYGTQATVGSQYHPSRHPGFNPDNWNMTLAQNTPLAENQKRIQAIFLMEAFCPMLGWTKIHPEYSIRLDGQFIGQIFLNGERLFDTTGDIIVKSNGNTFEFTNQHSCGGHASPSAVSGNRGGRPISGDGIVTMPSDSNWISGNTSGHNGLSNYGAISNFITVPRLGDMQLEFRAGTEMKISIYDTHFWETAQPSQIISIRFENSPIPTPKLVYNNYGPVPADEPQGKGGLRGSELNYHTRVDQFGNIRYRRSTQGPHWWCFNNGGALGRLRGRVNPNYSGNPADFWLDVPDPYPPGAADNPERQMLRGRLDNVAAAQWGPPGSADGISIFPPESNAGGSWESDVVRTMVPAVGDYRMIAARYEVPSNLWKRHPMWTNTATKEYTIHTFSGHWGDNDPGFDLPQGKDPRLLVADINFGNPNTLTNYARTPDLPPSVDYARAANSYGDFDTGIANAREGSYINKPDEGNFYAGNFTRSGNTKFYRSGYFFESWRQSDDWRSGLYMTPNRMIASPVMFGSLPTGVWNTGGSPVGSALDGTANTDLPCRPWQTLLFRPYVPSNIASYGAKSFHPGDAGPKDHFLLDMFFMPVVEPYAISEPLSVAGRVNMNYQIMPFTYIRRATAMHAVMKGEFITAIPDGDAYNAKTFHSSPNTAAVWDRYFDETLSPQKYWHRPINVSATLAQFDEKFENKVTGPSAAGLFRSASQICEIFLIPDVSSGTTVGGGETLPPLVNLTRTSRPIAMQAFWQNHRVTGDNIRERPYSNLYSRLTTRSNTFRVHVRAQVLRKARSTNPAVFDSDRDSILSEYRGSTLIERFIDPNDPLNPIPDYGGSGNPLNETPLETFYQFRVIESKRFNP